MGRRAQYKNEDFLDAAQRLISKHGLASVTIAAIAKEIGAPIGSVYHRFESREILLASARNPSASCRASVDSQASKEAA